MEMASASHLRLYTPPATENVGTLANGQPSTPHPLPDTRSLRPNLSSQLTEFCPETSYPLLKALLGLWRLYPTPTLLAGAGVVVWLSGERLSGSEFGQVVERWCWCYPLLVESVPERGAYRVVDQVVVCWPHLNTPSVVAKFHSKYPPYLQWLGGHKETLGMKGMYCHLLR